MWKEWTGKKFQNALCWQGRREPEDEDDQGIDGQTNQRRTYNRRANGTEEVLLKIETNGEVLFRKPTVTTACSAYE